MPSINTWSTFNPYELVDNANYMYNYWPTVDPVSIKCQTHVDQDVNQASD